jgi:hypothetical protein
MHPSANLLAPSGRSQMSWGRQSADSAHMGEHEQQRAEV